MNEDNIGFMINDYVYHMVYVLLYCCHFSRITSAYTCTVQEQSTKYFINNLCACELTRLIFSAIKGLVSLGQKNHANPCACPLWLPKYCAKLSRCIRGRAVRAVNIRSTTTAYFSARGPVSARHGQRVIRNHVT